MNLKKNTQAKLPLESNKILEVLVVEAGKGCSHSRTILEKMYGIEPEKVRFVDCPCCEYTFNADKHETTKLNLLN